MEIRKWKRWRSLPEVIANVKAALNSQLSKGKVVTIDLDRHQESDLTATTPMQHAGILVPDPTFDDWMDKLAEIRRSRLNRWYLYT
jgi:hypothetical protein